MIRPAWTAIVVCGGLLSAVASVGLVPMIVEGTAVRAVRARFALERLEAVGGGEGWATFQCGGRRIVLSERPAPGPSRGASRATVVIGVGDTAFTAVEPVAVRAGATGADRYWNRVVPYRWTDREAGRTQCGVAYRLPPDMLAIRRAREARPPTGLGTFLDAVRGVRPPLVHGARFGTVRWEEGGDPAREEDFASPDWDGDPYGTSVLNLLGSPVGFRNQSLSYWPTVLFPLVYPIGLALAGAALLVVGLIGRRSAAGRPPGRSAS